MARAAFPPVPPPPCEGPHVWQRVLRVRVCRHCSAAIWPEKEPEMPEEPENSCVTYYRRQQESVTDDFHMLPAGFDKELALSFLGRAFHKALQAAAAPMYPEKALGSGG